MALATAQTFSRSNLREYAFTRDNERNNFVDHVFDHSPTLKIFANQSLGDFGGVNLSGRGHRVVEGGHTITDRVVLGEHAGAKRNSGPYGTHNVAPDDNTRIAEANWAFYTHGLTIAEHEIRINRGEFARANFVAHQTRQVMKAVANMLAGDFYSTSAAANAITPLASLIGANDTLQGLAGGSYARYNARGLSAVGTVAASVSFASGSFAVQGVADMRTCWNNASEGTIQPDVITTGYGTHERYEGSLVPQERYAAPARLGDASFQALAFKQTPVLAERKCPDASMFMLSLDPEEGISLIVLSGADFDFSPFKPSSNQTVSVSPLELTCQTWIGNRQYGSNRMDTISD